MCLLLSTLPVRLLGLGQDADIAQGEKLYVRECRVRLSLATPPNPALAPLIRCVEGQWEDSGGMTGGQCILCTVVSVLCRNNEAGLLVGQPKRDAATIANCLRRL